MGNFMKAVQDAQEVGGQPRKVKTLLAALSEEDRKDLDAALRDPTISHASIVKALALHGHSFGQSTIGKWRREITQ